MSVDHNQTSSQSPAPGGRLKGRYLIERELGRGGVGVVFLARDERLHGMPVVIKFLLEDAERNKWLIGKFSQEAEALTRINHPGVVRVIDRDLSDDGRPFFVMEFIKGRPLRDVMGQGPLDLAYIAHLARQTGSALHAAHQQGVFHRDLKPENIMLEQLSGGDEQVKLIDFGIAKVVNPQAGNETEVAVVAGSRQYIAPEQLLSQTASPATDVYALAIIVYEMVTGRLPFNPDGPTHFLVLQELMRLQKGESFVTPRTFRPDLPEAAQILLLNALSFDPGRRPQNARIYTEDLAQALIGKISASDARATIAVPSPVPGSAQVAVAPLETDIIDTLETPIQARATTPNVAAPTSAPNSQRSETNPIKERKETSVKPKGGKFPIVAGLIIAIGVVAAAGVVGVPRLYAWLNTNVTPSPTPLTATPSPVTPGAERTFSYWITVRKDPKLFPNAAPTQFAEEKIIPSGYRVQISFISPQPGHLYIINESPSVAGQATRFNILFPTPTTNQGSAISAGQTVHIPGHDDGLVLDNEQGEEKIWLIWTAGEVADLEPLKRWYNSTDAGEIKDAAEVESLRKFLATHSAAKPEVTPDETSKQTRVKMNGDILVKLVKLQHY